MKPLKQQLFEENKSAALVETGTSKGWGIEMALQCGYPEIFSVENDEQLAREAEKKFRKYKHVWIIEGDSAERFKDLLYEIPYRSTFWLDAHDAEKGECAALRELAAIAESPHKSCTIMIDDWEDFDTPKHGNITKASVIEALRRINPDYKIACYYAEVGAPNILVAKV